MFERDWTHNGIECPKCGRNTIVRHGENRWSCIHCNFSRNLDDSPDHVVNWFVLLLLAAIALALVTDVLEDRRRSRPSRRSGTVMLRSLSA